MTHPKLEELKRLCDKATPGPWDQQVSFRGMIWPSANDAKFIAAARTYMPLLLDIAEAAQFYAEANNYIEATMTVKEVNREEGSITIGDSIFFGAPALADKGERMRKALAKLEK